jgi:transposase-like protein
MTVLLATIFSLLTKYLLKNEPTTEQSRTDTHAKLPCPRCGSHHTIKNGSTHNGKPKRQCKDCGRQFVVNPSKQPISEETKQLIDQLLLERISLRGIARVTGVSWSWLQNYVNNKLAAIPRQVKVSDKPKGRLIIECDEMTMCCCLHRFLGGISNSNSEQTSSSSSAIGKALSPHHYFRIITLPFYSRTPS